MGNDIYDLAERVLASKPAETSQEKTITITGDERRRLESLLGKNLSTAKELIHQVERITVLEIADVKVPLSPFLLDRLHSRAIRVQFDEFLKTTVKRLLEEYAGLR